MRSWFLSHHHQVSSKQNRKAKAVPPTFSDSLATHEHKIPRPMNELLFLIKPPGGEAK